MKNLLTTTLAVSGLILSSISTSAQAGANIWVFYEPVETAIPTLGFWGLLLAAGLLAAVGFRFIRSKDHATAKLLGVGFVIMSMTVAMNSETIAQPMLSFDVLLNGEKCSGGSDPIPPIGDPELINDCTVPMQVTDYQLSEPVFCELNTTPCPVGTILAPGTSCELAFLDNCN